MQQVHNIAHHAHYFSIRYSIYLLITSFFINLLTISCYYIFFTLFIWSDIFDSCFALCVVERILEDHDTLVENMVMWTRDTKNRILFEERGEKNDLFRRPEVTPLTPCHVTVTTTHVTKFITNVCFCFRNTYKLHKYKLRLIVSNWVIDCFVFYTISAIFQPCNRGFKFRDLIHFNGGMCPWSDEA